MSKEWWIDDVTQRVCAPIDHPEFGLQTMLWPDNEKVILVVEKTAYLALLAQAEAMANGLHSIRYNFKMSEQDRMDCAEEAYEVWQRFKEQK